MVQKEAGSIGFIRFPLEQMKSWQAYFAARRKEHYKSQIVTAVEDFIRLMPNVHQYWKLRGYFNDNQKNFEKKLHSAILHEADTHKDGGYSARFGAASAVQVLHQSMVAIHTARKVDPDNSDPFDVIIPRLIPVTVKLLELGKEETQKRDTEGLVDPEFFWELKEALPDFDKSNKFSIMLGRFVANPPRIWL